MKVMLANQSTPPLDSLDREEAALAVRQLGESRVFMEEETRHAKKTAGHERRFWNQVNITAISGM